MVVYIILGLLTLLVASWCVLRGFRKRDERIDDMEAELRCLKEKYERLLARLLVRKRK